MRYGANDTPLWLEAAAVWLEGRSGRLAGGKCKSSQAARERAQRRTRPQRDSGNIRLDGSRLGVCKEGVEREDVAYGDRKGYIKKREEEEIDPRLI